MPIRFFIITFAWSWVMWLLPVLMNKKSKISNDCLIKIKTSILVIGAFGPAMGAFVSLYTINGKPAVINFIKSFLFLNFGLKAWLAIILICGFSSFIAWIVPELFGEKRLWYGFKNIYLLPLNILIMTFLGGGQEEIGWRGFIMPLLETQYGLIIGSLILGIIWAIWHIPLWFIPGTSQSYMNFLPFVFGCIGMSYIFSWVIAESGNRLLSGLIVHGIFNSIPSVFPSLNMETKAKQPRFWLHQFLVFIIGIFIVVKRVY